MKKNIVWKWFYFLLFFGFYSMVALPPVWSQEFPQSTIFQGIQVECDLLHLDKNKKKGEYFEGDDVLFQFKITDTLTKTGLSGAYPAAWLGLNPPDQTPDCTRKIESFLSGSTFNRAELDMNVYYVLTMNEDASITVVDPLFGYGGTKMLASISLKSPAMDWVIMEHQEHLFVSQPGAKEVAVVQTSNWEILKDISIPGVPVHTRLQPDENYLWVTFVSEKENDQKETGVAVINTATLEVQTILLTGAGWHEITFSSDSHFAFVTNGLSNNLTVIDIANLEKIKDVPTGITPTSIAWSSLANAVYVGHKQEGQIAVVDGQNHNLLSTIQAESGIEQIAFPPNGRYGFVVNPLEDIVHIVDAVNNQIVQTADVEDQPEQINFSDELAYVRHRGSEIVLMIPLTSVGVPNTPVQVVDFPGGQNPPGATSLPSVASGIVQAPGESAMLIANSMDKTIYYYMEGMAAPMGNFSNYGKEPRAVMVVDRSLKEVENGVYQTIVQLRDRGNFDIAFFMNAPRLIHCFNLDVKISPAALLEKEIAAFGNIRIEYLNKAETISLSETNKIRFKIFDRRTNKLLEMLSDVQVLQMSNSGLSYQNVPAIPTEAPGVYEVDIQDLKEGIYLFHIECLSQGFYFNQSIPRGYEIISSRSTTK